MGFWIFMLVMNLLIPGVMIVFGRVFLRHPPKSINEGYGYRTTRSMKNMETWKFAHQYCGKIWYRWGLVLLPLTVIAMCLLIGKDDDTVGYYGGIICFVQMVPMVGAIFPTERALKKKFGN